MKIDPFMQQPNGTVKVVVIVFGIVVIAAMVLLAVVGLDDGTGRGLDTIDSYIMTGGRVTDNFINSQNPYATNPQIQYPQQNGYQANPQYYSDSNPQLRGEQTGNNQLDN